MANGIRFTDKAPGDWYHLWCEDKESTLMTRVKNLCDDLTSRSVSPTSISAGEQIAEIMNARNHLMVDYHRLRFMSPEDRARWCFDDMKRRGVIE